MRVSTTGIVEQYLRTSRVVKVSTMYFPVACQVMYFLVLGNDHLAIKVEYARLTRDTVIEKNTVLVGVGKTTNVYFPGIVPECILLLPFNAKIMLEIEYDDIRHTSLRLPIL